MFAAKRRLISLLQPLGVIQVDGTKELKRQVEELDDLAHGETSKMAGVTEGLAV